jgi:4-aminobutyrate aminotransferase-like enzyme
VLANAIGDHILRILPPLIIGPTEIERFIEALSDSLDEAGATGAP